MSLLIKLPATESSEAQNVRRKSVKRASSPMDEDTAPPVKRSRIQRSPDGSDENEDLESPSTSRQLARTPLSSSRSVRSKPSNKKKRSKIVLSDPESEEFDPMDDESEVEAPVDDDDEYMSEPKNPVKRAGKAEPKEIMAKDERKRPVDASEPAFVKRPRTKAPPKSGGETIIDVVGEAPSGDGPPAKEEAAPVPPKKKLPQIKKNKPANTVGGPVPASAVTPTQSVAAKAAPLIAGEESKLPPLTGVTRKVTLPASADVDLSNPMMYAQLFKSGGGSTPSGFSRREKDEERRKELNKMRDEARAKRINEAPPAFDLQGQMDKIIRFEERLRTSRSPAVYPNFLAGALKQLQLGKKCYAGTDLDSAREEGEM
ncbi:hypothetical protein C8R43DRAFT_1125871 [Mycena crocata]|nr:hypothetical protein C8R43DRAFT_1125871 [Mycena crocata]